MKKEPVDFQELYGLFRSPCTEVDCGEKCTPFNPSGKPFCCDICHAVPVAYRQEWKHLEGQTDLWHLWCGDECQEEPCDPTDLESQTPAHLTLLSCKGPHACERDFRTVSCRQFPFFPYITSDFRFVGLAYDWDFTPVCWVLSHLDQVSLSYRNEFITAFDRIFSAWLEDLDSYVQLSEDMREHFRGIGKRFPLLHRNGHTYLVSPGSEKMRRCEPNSLPRFGPYKNSP